jgi:hypothetical protein
VGLLSFSSCKKDIPGIFENMGEFGQLFPIAVNEKIGHINKEGEIVINPMYYKDGDLYEFFFINGLTPVSTDDGKYGFINKKGNPRIMLNQYNGFSCHFWYGMAWVEDKHGDYGFIVC